MKKQETSLKDCYIIEPDVFEDDRGYFTEYFSEKKLKDEGLDYIFEKVVQTNRSKSKKGTLRGMHFQKGEHAQAKLVECIKGAVLDVAVDMRQSSPSFGKWISVELTEKNHKQLLIPKGFAHGFLSLEDNTIFQYLIDNDYSPENEAGIPWNDPGVNIPWKEMFEKYGIDKPILSEKDGKHLVLSKSPKYFTYRGDK